MLRCSFIYVCCTSHSNWSRQRGPDERHTESFDIWYQCRETHSKSNQRMSKNSRTTIPHAVYDTHNQESSIPEIAEYPTIIKRHDMVVDYWCNALILAQSSLLTFPLAEPVREWCLKGELGLEVERAALLILSSGSIGILSVNSSLGV